MNCTFFTYSNNLTDPDSKMSIFSSEFHAKQPCLEKMISIINKKTADIIDMDDAEIRIVRNHDQITADFGNGPRVFTIVEMLYLINGDNVNINAKKRALKPEYINMIRKFAKANKENLIKKDIFLTIDNIGEHEGETHNIIKIVANTDNTMVLTQDKETKTFYVSYLENWSYDMLNRLITMLKIGNGL